MDWINRSNQSNLLAFAGLRRNTARAKPAAGDGERPVCPTTTVRVSSAVVGKNISTGIDDQSNETRADRAGNSGRPDDPSAVGANGVGDRTEHEHE